MTFTPIRATGSALLIAFVLASPANAQKLYKVVDEKGNVSYQDKPPIEEKTDVHEKYVNRSTMKLRETKPAKVRTVDQSEEEPEELSEADPDFVPDEHSKGRVAVDVDSDEVKNLPSDLTEIPADAQRSALREYKKTQDIILENGVSASTATKRQAPRKKAKRLSPDELKDIARSTGQ